MLEWKAFLTVHYEITLCNNFGKLTQGFFYFFRKRRKEAKRKRIIVIQGSLSVHALTKIESFSESTCFNTCAKLLLFC